jgi:predicted transposase/invertase (TIGR01784 family)
MKLEDMCFDIKPTDDYVFKRIFGVEKNKGILIGFLNVIFEEYNFLPQIKSIEYLNTEIPKEFDPEKQGILDIRATINDDTEIDIEVQTKDRIDLIDRGITYCSRMISNNTLKGGDYTKPKVISVWIVKDKLRKDNPHYNRRNPIEIDQHFTMPGVLDKEFIKTSNKTTIIYIYLSKLQEGLYTENINNWLKFMDNQPIYDVNDENLVEANKELDYIRGDKKARCYYEAKIKYILNKNSERKEAIEEGLKEGEKNKSIEIAKNMLKLNIDINIISQSTGLDIEEIKNLL